MLDRYEAGKLFFSSEVNQVDAWQPLVLGADLIPFFFFVSRSF